MRKTAQTTWDDVTFVLAVAEQGSVSSAARVLSVNHATVLRRIAAFESRQGIRVFDRTARGYQVSPERRGLIEAMREAHAALAGVDRMIDAERPRLSSAVRVTSTDTIAQLVLPPLLPDLAAEIEAQIDLSSANTHVDFGRMEAHITVRPAAVLPDDLQGERIGELWFGIYGKSKRTKGHLGLSGPLARAAVAEWWRDRVGLCDLSADSFLTLASLAAQGRGQVVLPTLCELAFPQLKRLEVVRAVKPVPVWVASHVDLAKSGRLVRARRFILNRLRGHPAFSEPKSDR